MSPIIMGPREMVQGPAQVGKLRAGGSFNHQPVWKGLSLPTPALDQQALPYHRSLRKTTLQQGRQLLLPFIHMGSMSTLQSGLNNSFCIEIVIALLRCTVMRKTDVSLRVARLSLLIFVNLL